MKIKKTGKHRFGVKAARRSWRFWWQAALILLITWILWGQLPLHALWPQPRRVESFPAPACAWVILTPQMTEQALEASRMTWRSFQSEREFTGQLDMGMFDLKQTQVALPYVPYAAQEYHKKWQVTPLTRPEWLSAPLVVDDPRMQSRLSQAPPPLPEGLSYTLDASLAASGLQFELQPQHVLSRSGEASFWVELNAAGKPLHLLLATPPSDDSAILERLLLRGRGTHAAEGWVHFYWNYKQILKE